MGLHHILFKYKMIIVMILNKLIKVKNGVKY